MTVDANNPKLNSEGARTDEQVGRPYDPPKVIRVNLRPEEAVLGHCKVSGMAGPASGSCTVPGCFVPGS